MTSRSISLHLRALALTVGMSLFGVLALASPPTALATYHPYISEIGGIEDPCGVTVDPANGDVYVADFRNSIDAIEIFNSANQYQSSITGTSVPSGSFGEGACSIGVSDVTGDVYVTDANAGHVIYVFNAAGHYERTMNGSGTPKEGGTPSESFGTGQRMSVAVNQVTGEVDVSDESDGVVDEFNSADEYVSQLKVEAPQVLAVSPSGDIFVGTFPHEHGELYGFNSSGHEILHMSGLYNVESIAADSAGDVYVNEGLKGEEKSVVNEFDSLGNLIGYASLTSDGTFGPGIGIALSPGGDLYVVGINGVDVFGPGVPVRAQVEEETVSVVGSTVATLSALVNDYGESVTYYYEYGLNSSYGHRTSSMAFTAARGEVGSSVQVGGLQPDTTYHFRMVTEDAAGTSQGADATFTTSPTPMVGLPDRRGYEMVTPLDNNNAELYHFQGLIGEFVFESGAATRLPFRAAADGDAVAYVGAPTAGGSGGTANIGGGGNEYLAMRSSAGGWTQANIQPSGNPNQYYEGFSSDLSVGILDSDGEAEGVQGVPTGYAMDYVRDSDGSYHPFFTGDPPYRLTGEFEATEVHGASTGKSLAYAGSSSDMQHMLFEANDALTSSAPGGDGQDPSTGLAYSQENNLYDSVNGKLYLVNVLPDGTSAAGATFGGPQFVYTPGNEFAKFGLNPPDFSNAISADGSRIFWSSLMPEEEEGHMISARPSALYVRENDTQPESPLNEKGECTVPTDACTVLIAKSYEVHFWTASADGSKIFYTKDLNLYEYDLPLGQTTGTTIDLTPGGGETGVLGVLGASEDGEYVYFTATEALAEGAVAAKANLYVIHDGVTKFIAALSPHDESLEPPYVSNPGENGEIGDWQPALGRRTSEVAPDGQGIVFMSSESLTGYPNKGLPEVYAYEIEEGRLHCVSCSPSGEPPPLTSKASEEQAGGFLPISGSNTFMLRVISEDGNRVFFDSVEPLVPEAVNGRVNVYEWERDGSGSCAEAAGCVYLLSGGASTAGSWLVDASANGDNVFFETRGKLVPGDLNENIDLYDARVGAAQPVTQPKCSGTGCQGVPSAPPIFASPASSTFTGVGNFPPASAVAEKPKPKAKPLTRSQKLAKALKACAAKPKAKRKRCEANARKRYGKTKKAKKPAKGGK